MPQRDTKTLRRAFIEAIVIAVGVFVALAADNWNDDRKDRILEQQFLDGIVLDLELNTERITQLKGVASRLRGSLERMIQALHDGQNGWDSPNDFVEDLVSCTYLGTPLLSSVAYDELQSTGSMRLIRNTAFKRKLADYYAEFSLQSQFHPEYRRKEAAAEEALLGFLPLDDRLAMSDSVESLDSDIDVERTLDELRSQPDLLARLEDMVWVQHRILTRYDETVERGADLLADIEMMRSADH